MSDLPAPFRRVGVIGLGLIGGSVCMAVKARWPEVTVVGCDAADQVALASQRQVVSSGSAEVGTLYDCDLIVVAVPLSASAGVLASVVAMGTNAVVTDVGSTKRGVMAAARAAGARRFVGGHPMAGAERPGLEQARGDLFVNRPWLLVRGTADDADGARLEQFVAALGARPSWMDATAHDRAVAYVSHLPQVLAAALMKAADEGATEAGQTAAGPAFAEMTRLASSPPDMWQAVLSENADFVAEALARFAGELPSVADLQSGAWVRQVLTQAGEARGRWRRP